MGPAEQEEGGSLQVPCQPDISSLWCCESRALRPRRSAPQPVAVMRAKERASPLVGQVYHVPTEISKFLVDALESHGYCVGVQIVCGSGLRLLR